MASVHLQERKFICDACGMRFKRKDILHQHLQSHAYEGKLHNCGLCENTYKSAYSLKEHMAMHANKKDVQCKVCDKAFNTNMILQKHMKNVHDTPGYKCDICDKVVNTPFNLKRHRQRHTADSVMLENSYSAYLINDKVGDILTPLLLHNIPNMYFYSRPGTCLGSYAPYSMRHAPCYLPDRLMLSVLSLINYLKLII